MTSGDQLATEYADTMVESIRDIMARYSGTGHDDQCECDNECHAYADSGPTTPCRECECAERARTELLETYALELVAERGEPYSVLLTYGGPTAWVEWSGRQGTDSAELRVSWSSDVKVRRSDDIRALASFYAEIMEGDE